MKTLDAHHHFWHYTPEEFNWLDDTPDLQRDYLPAEFKPQIDAAGVDGVITVQTRGYRVDNDYMLGFAEQHDWVVAVVGHSPVTQGEAAVREHLERFLPRRKFVGIREVTQHQPAGFMLDDDFNAGLGMLKDFDLRFDLCIYENQLPETIELVDRHPQQVFVLDHLGKPRIRDGAFESWAENFRGLAERANVFCKLSGLVTEADWSAWTVEQLRPYMDVAVEAFGPDRLMFGTDWPVCRSGVEYGRWTQIVRDHAQQLSESEQASLFAGAAARAYGINDFA